MGTDHLLTDYIFDEVDYADQIRKLV